MPVDLFETLSRERGVDPLSPQGGESGKVLEREHWGAEKWNFAWTPPPPRPPASRAAGPCQQY